MLSFFGGGNPFNQNPLQALAQTAQPDPETTGAIGQPAPSPAATPPAAAPAEPGIMDRIGNGFSGRGFFGGAGSPADNVTDPVTGMSPGIERQANMQTMMKMGLTFLAAGQNMSNDQRAAILSKAPGLIGDNSGVNDFARSRLEMAKLKLAERQQMQEEASAKMIAQAVNGGAAPAGDTAAPSAGAQAVQTAQAGTAATAQAVAPDVAPALAQPTAAPGAQMGVPPSMTGGVPRFSPAEKLGILAQTTTAGKANMLGQTIQQQAAREVEGQPVFNSQTNKFQVPVYRGDGTLVRMKDGDTPAPTTRDTVVNGQTMRQKGYALPNGQFHVTEQSEVRDPAQDRNDKTYVDLAASDRKELMTAYQEKIQTGEKNYDKMRDISDQVREGKGIFGTGSGMVKTAIRALATISPGKKELADYLNVPANFERVMKSGVAGVIQDFNGSANVSDADRKFAQEVMQAASSGSREEVLNALKNGMNDQKGLIAKYNENANRHNSGITGLDERVTTRLKVPIVTRNFDEEEQLAEAARAKKGVQPGGGGNAPVAEPGAVIKYTRDKDGKLVRAQ